MALMMAMRQEVVRIRPGIKTARGSEVPDWENADEIVIGGCSVQPAGTGLSQDGRVLGVMVGMTVYLPGGADVKPGDRIKYDGATYDISGEPRKWNSASGNLDNIVLNLVRYSG